MPDTNPALIAAACAAWLRSFALRTALGIAAAALLLSLLGAGWGWLRAETALRQELDLVLAGEAEGLIRDYQAIGPDALLDAARISARRDALLLVLVQTADGQTLAGRMAGAPAALRGFATLRAPGEPPLRALGALLPGGINLVVAARLSAAEDAARALAWTPLIAALGSGAVALLLGFVGARALERRLASVSDVAGLLTAGDLSRRLPQSGRGDEFDRLVVTVNAHARQAGDAGGGAAPGDGRHRPRPARPAAAAAAGAGGGAAGRSDDPTLPLAIAELDAVLETFAALLRIARAEAGAGSRQELDLSALVTAVADAYAPVAEEAGRAFATAVAPGLRVHGRPGAARAHAGEPAGQRARPRRGRDPRVAGARPGAPWSPTRGRACRPPSATRCCTASCGWTAAAGRPAPGSGWRW